MESSNGGKTVRIKNPSNVQQGYMKKGHHLDIAWQIFIRIRI